MAAYLFRGCGSWKYSLIFPDYQFLNISRILFSRYAIFVVVFLITRRELKQNIHCCQTYYLLIIII